MGMKNKSKGPVRNYYWVSESSGAGIKNILIWWGGLSEVCGCELYNLIWGVLKKVVFPSCKNIHCVTIRKNMDWMDGCWKTCIIW